MSVIGSGPVAALNFKQMKELFKVVSNFFSVFRKILFDKLHLDDAVQDMSTKSSDEETLLKLVSVCPNPLPALILEFRKVSKFASTGKNSLFIMRAHALKTI